ncbi:MAG: phosphodiester glycosidase family protein [Chloroflexi bacterium]|nr:phosphodiester glycosidase family protein [Chloroflexota bacterium]
MPKRRPALSIVWILIILCLCVGAPGLYYAGRPLPVEMREELYDGVVYHRKVHLTPHLMIAHIITVDLHTEGISFLVTPPDYTKKRDEHPLKARTTSRFLDEFGLQVAVNADGFSPWYSNSFLDYYPHPGDPVTPNGFAASRGKRYSDGVEPTLYISRDNVAQFGSPKGKIYNAISGSHMLVENGEPVAGLDDSIPAPRTAIGVDFGPDRLVIVVVDGRQPFYSEGATLAELADLLISYGAYAAMNLDGGGSSTLVVAGPFGPRVVNSPIDSHIPGRERPVANHLGVYAGNK